MSAAPGILGADRCPCTGKRIRGRAGDCGDAGDGGRDRKFRREVRRKPSECGICARTGRNERTEIRAEVPMDEGHPRMCRPWKNPRSRMQETVTTVWKRLSSDEEFSALLYAVQQYLGKTFSAIECEKFAYFYDVLHMSCELLEYLAEYCAEGGHTSIRYIEKVALKWYEEGIHTKDEAREYSIRYSKDMSAVKKAFGIMGRILNCGAGISCAAGLRNLASIPRSSRRHATGRSRPQDRRVSCMRIKSSRAGKKTA